jgi:hypothetical protein
MGRFLSTLTPRRLTAHGCLDAPQFASRPQPLLLEEYGHTSALVDVTLVTRDLFFNQASHKLSQATPRCVLCTVLCLTSRSAARSCQPLRPAFPAALRCEARFSGTGKEARASLFKRSELPAPPRVFCQTLQLSQLPSDARAPPPRRRAAAPRAPSPRARITGTVTLTGPRPAPTRTPFTQTIACGAGWSSTARRWLRTPSSRLGAAQRALDVNGCG